MHYRVKLGEIGEGDIIDCSLGHATLSKNLTKLCS